MCGRGGNSEFSRQVRLWVSGFAHRRTRGRKAQANGLLKEFLLPCVLLGFCGGLQLNIGSLLWILDINRSCWVDVETDNRRRGFYRARLGSGSSSGGQRIEIVELLSKNHQARTTDNGWVSGSM